MKRGNSKPKKKRQPTCTQCKTRFRTTDRRRKLCDNCKLEPFFQSNDYMFLYRALKKLPYLEQFPDSTEGLIELLEYVRFCKVARGYHVVENECIDFWDFNEQPQLEWRHHHSLDISHLYPRDGTPTNRALKGKLIAANLILLPSELNRSMKNNHAFGDAFFDSKKAKKLSGNLNEKFMQFLAKNYDLLEVTRRLKRFKDATFEDTELTRSFDATKVKLIDILRQEFERLSLTNNRAVKEFFSKKLRTLQEWELSNSHYEDFDFDDDFFDDDNKICNTSIQAASATPKSSVDARTEEQICFQALNDVSRAMQASYQPMQAL